ncbi:hypothetical protein ACIQI8_27195 [Streptomyces sp. NPDC092369]|uniref:hypothetical protein n=1 Tax=Streptomyces sp. NPDC092369 TaxID=3366015 RepID=UPI00382C6A52
MPTPADELAAAVETLRNATFRGAMTATPAVAALLRAREPLANWLGSWGDTDIDEHAAMPDDLRHALLIARAINASTTK